MRMVFLGSGLSIFRVRRWVDAAHRRRDRGADSGCHGQVTGIVKKENLARVVSDVAAMERVISR